MACGCRPIHGGLVVIGLNGTLSGTTTLESSVNLPYEFDNLTVLPGPTLILRPGVVVKERLTFAGMNTKPALTVRGSLQALGTADSEVVITSIKDDTWGRDSNGDGNVSAPAGGDWLPLLWTVPAT